MDLENPSRRDAFSLIGALAAAVAGVAYAQEADYQDVGDRTDNLQEEIRQRTEAISEYWINYIETKRTESRGLMQTYLREWVEGVYEHDYLEAWEKEIETFILEENPMVFGASLEDFELEYNKKLEAIAVKNQALVKVMNRVLQDAQNPFLGEATQTLQAKLEKILEIQDTDRKVEKLQHLEDELWRQIRYEKNQGLMRDWLYITALIDTELRATQSRQFEPTAHDINDDLDQEGTASREGPTPFIFGHETGGITADETYYQNPDAQMGIGQKNPYDTLFNVLVLQEIEQRLQRKVELYDKNVHDQPRMMRNGYRDIPAFHGQESNIQGFVYQFFGPNNYEDNEFGRIKVKLGPFHRWYNNQLGHILPHHIEVELAKELGEEPFEDVSQLEKLHPIAQMVVLAWLENDREPLSVDWETQFEEMSPEQLKLLQGFDTFRKSWEIPSVIVTERSYGRNLSIAPMPKGRLAYHQELAKLDAAMSEHGYFLLESGGDMRDVLDHPAHLNMEYARYAYSNKPGEDGRQLTAQEILNHWAQIDLRKALLPIASGVAVGLRYFDLERLLEEPPVIELKPDPRYNLAPELMFAPPYSETKRPTRDIPPFEPREESRAGEYRLELVPEEDEE